MKTLVIFLFLGAACHYERVSCMRSNMLEEGVFNNWKYLYYSNKPKYCFEEIIRFYCSDLNNSNFRMSNYRYFGQQNWLKNRFWDHYNLVPVNSAQPYIDVITNIMLTDSNKEILSGIDPNLIKLSDGGFLSNNMKKIQYNTNYLIFLDIDLVVEQFHLYEKYKKNISDYLINNNDRILSNFNTVLQNYKN